MPPHLQAAAASHGASTTEMSDLRLQLQQSEAVRIAQVSELQDRLNRANQLLSQQSSANSEATSRQAAGGDASRVRQEYEQRLVSMVKDYRYDVCCGF